MGLRERLAKDVEQECALRSHFLVDGEVEFDRECYGCLRSYEDGYDREYHYAEELIVFHPKTDRFCEDIYNWVVSDEVFGEVFLDTSLENGLKRGWEINTDLPYQQVLAGMIALRYSFSQNHPTIFYAKARKYGAKLLEALILSHIFYMDVEKILCYGHLPDHTIFSPNLDVKSVVDSGGKTLKPMNACPTKQSTILEDLTWNMFPKVRSSLYDRFSKHSSSLGVKTERKNWGGDLTYLDNEEKSFKILIEALRKGVFN